MLNKWRKVFPPKKWKHLQLLTCISLLEQWAGAMLIIGINYSTWPWWQQRSCPGKQYCDSSRLHTIDICPNPIGRCPKAQASLAYKPPRTSSSGLSSKSITSWVSSRWSLQTASPGVWKWITWQESSLFCLDVQNPAYSPVIYQLLLKLHTYPEWTNRNRMLLSPLVWLRTGYAFVLRGAITVTTETTILHLQNASCQISFWFSHHFVRGISQLTDEQTEAQKLSMAVLVVNDRIEV